MVAAMALVVVLVAGGLADLGRAERPYWRSVDRSYALQVRAVAAQSSATGRELAALLARLSGLDRSSLATQLAALVAQARQTQAFGSSLAPPAPARGAAAFLEAALAERSAATAELQRSVGGLLGLGGDGPSLSVPQATSALVAVGRLLSSSDARWRDLRAELARSPGHPSVPASAWVTHPATFSAPAAGAVARTLASSPNLAVRHDVVLLQNGVALDPEPVPPPAPQAGQASSVPSNASVLPPTQRVHVSALVANHGDVTERHLSVSLTLEGLGSGATRRSSATVRSLAPGAVTAVGLPPLPVASHQEYLLEVAVRPPAGQPARGPLSQRYAIWIAPAT